MTHTHNKGLARCPTGCSWEWEVQVLHGCKSHRMERVILKTHLHTPPCRPSFARASLKSLKTSGGGLPQNPLPPFPDQSDLEGKNELYIRENLVGLFLVHKLLAPPLLQ